MHLYKSLSAFSIFAFLWMVTAEDVQELGKIGMDQTKFCEADSIKLFQVGEKKHIIVLGRNTPVDSPSAAPSCQVAFGPSGDLSNGWYLRLRFESFYINQCDITVKIFQSPSTLFETGVEEMVHLECNMRPPEFLYTKKDHYLLISLSRPDQYARNYQYRLNISMSEGPTETGLSTPVVAIVGVGVLMALCLLVCLLTKYAVRMKEAWREKRAENAIERASRLYNSSIHDGDEPHLHLVQPPSRSQHSSNSYTPAPHSDTVCVVYRRNGSLDSRDQVEIQNHGGRQLLSGAASNPPAAVELECEDLPPSYEEALQMPMPDRAHTAVKEEEPVYANT